TMESDSSIDDNNELETGFQLVMRACQSFYQSKIISNDKDLSGIILYGTEKNKNTFDFNHIYILHELAQPSAERIMQLEALSNKNTYKKTYNDLFGSTQSKNYSLNEALWTCSNLFANSPQRLTIKRVFIFTCNDQPHASNLTLERQAKQRAKDLNDVGIEVEVFPILTESITTFDYKKFFQDVLMLSDDELELRNNQAPTGRLNELLKLVYSKEHKKRAYCTVPFSLGETSDGTPLQFSVSVFNMVRPCPKPTKIKLDMKTNMETKIVTKHYLPETAEILMPSDIQYGIDVSNRRVLFDADEIKAIKKFSDPGFQILGFKNISCLLPHRYVKPDDFIYPDEKYVHGSSCLFNTLLKECLEKQMFILCQFTARRNTPLRLASNGFHLHYLPYADDIQTLSKNDIPRITNDEVDADTAATSSNDEINKLDDNVNLSAADFDFEDDDYNFSAFDFVTENGNDGFDPTTGGEIKRLKIQIETIKEQTKNSKKQDEKIDLKKQLRKCSKQMKTLKEQQSKQIIVLEFSKI
ncbi:unnamed protein product, partial [Adineta steineri]